MNSFNTINIKKITNYIVKLWLTIILEQVESTLLSKREVRENVLGQNISDIDGA